MNVIGLSHIIDDPDGLKRELLDSLGVVSVDLAAGGKFAWLIHLDDGKGRVPLPSYDVGATLLSVDTTPEARRALTEIIVGALRRRIAEGESYEVPREPAVGG